MNKSDVSLFIGSDTRILKRANSRSFERVEKRNNINMYHKAGIRSKVIPNTEDYGNARTKDKK